MGRPDLVELSGEGFQMFQTPDVVLHIAVRTEHEDPAVLLNRVAAYEHPVSDVQHGDAPGGMTWQVDDAEFASTEIQDIPLPDWEDRAAPAAAAAPAAPADKTAVAPKPAPAQAPEPAAAPAAAPVAAPARQRRAPKTGSALSMSAILQEKEEKPVEEAPAVVEAALPDDDAIRVRWKELVPRYESQPRLASALAKAELRMTVENGVKSVFFSVSNAAQKKWIEDKILRDMETAFREILKCRKVNLHVDDIPEEEPGEKKPYMPEERRRT